MIVMGRTIFVCVRRKTDELTMVFNKTHTVDALKFNLPLSIFGKNLAAEKQLKII